MKLLPYAKLTFDSSLSVLEVAAKLNEYIMPYDWYDNVKYPTKFYFGKVNESDFRIWRIIKKGRNSLVPTVTGKIEKRGSGSKITLTMQFRPGIIIFPLCVMSMFTYAGIKAHSPEALITLPLIYIMIIFSFDEEYKITKEDFKKILEVDNANK